MSRAGLEKFLYRFDKDPALQAGFTANAHESLAAFDLDETERTTLAAHDVATLYEWGVHPLLIRNFSGTLGIKYVAEYRKRGLEK